MPRFGHLTVVPAAATACAVAFAVYASLGVIAHEALRTNAFDLSVFDYALWTTASGGPVAWVPMFRHSLFAQHFMPTLLLLAPLTRVFDSPVYLIVLQTAFYAVAALLFFHLAIRHVPNRFAWALLAAFLLSRRTHSAVTSYFYIESAEPMLIFGALLAWSERRAVLYWLLVLAALGCKEDVALYFAMFGVVLLVQGRDRPMAIATIVVSSVWLAAALLIVIPSWSQGAGTGNVFLEGRYALGDGAQAMSALVDRAWSLNSLGTLLKITSATAFLCLLAPAWFVVALPGILLNLVALPDTGQAGLIGHYLWPILPWLFVAAIFGTKRLPPALMTNRWAPVAILLVALIDMPLPRSLAQAPWQELPAASEVRSQLVALAPTGTIVAQPNLIPHLATRQRDVHGYGVYSAGQPSGTYVLFTKTGDLWPLDGAGVDREIARFAADPAYEQVLNGPLFAFRKR